MLVLTKLEDNDQYCKRDFAARPATFVTKEKDFCNSTEGNESNSSLFFRGPEGLKLDLTTPVLILLFQGAASLA